jgi:lysozyme
MSATILDVSKYQGRIDWHVLAAVGACDGAIVKATDGQTGVDPRFAENLDGANIVGLLLGTYHFAQPDETDGDAEMEARHYVTTVQAQATKSPARTHPLLYALDVEKARETRKGAPFVAWCRKFVETVEAMTGLVCWVYTGGPFWNDADGDISVGDAAFFAQRPLWLAAYVSDPTRYVAMTPWREVGITMHQWAGDVQPNGKPGLRYPGITENVVDTNRFGGSIEVLRAIIARPAPHLRDTDPAPPPDSDAPTWPGGREPIADLSEGTAVTPLRAGEAEHTPIHLREPSDQ